MTLALRLLKSSGILGQEIEVWTGPDDGGRADSEECRSEEKLGCGFLGRGWKLPSHLRSEHAEPVVAPLQATAGPTHGVGENLIEGPN